MPRRPTRPYALFAALALFGCATIHARAIPFPGQPTVAPTDASAVQIADRPPERPHVVIGQVILEPEGDASKAQIEDKLREVTAQMGGDAAVIVADPARRVGSVWDGGPWWEGGKIQPVTGSVVSAIVVRFKPS